MSTTQYHAARRTARAIAEGLERDIDAGRYGQGDALPTIRALASDLDVSPTTVSAAFAMLRERGRIVGRTRGGSIVVGKLALQSATPVPAPRGVRDVAVADPDPVLLPPLQPALAHIRKAAKVYSEVRDHGPLIAHFRTALEADGIDPSGIGVAGGALDAIERGLLAMTKPGDLVAFEDPGYPQALALAAALGLRVIRMAVDERGITPEGLTNAISAGCKAVVLVPRAQNPTGASLDAKRARALRGILANARELGVIEDDYLAMLCKSSLHSLVPGRARWLHVRSLAKVLGPDIRVAVFAADSLTHARVLARQRVGYGWVSTLLQETANAVLRAPGTRKLLAEARSTYARRREALLAACARSGLTARGSDGFTVWISVPDEAAAVRSALAAGFAIDAGARYREDSHPGVRVAITRLPPQESPTLARAIASAISTYP